MALIMDIETFYNPENDPGYFAYRTSNISAPTNYKNPDKIQAYIEEKKKAQMDKAALDPRMAQIVLVGMLSDTQFEGFDFNPDTKLYQVQFGIADTKQAEINLLQFTLKTIHAALVKGIPLVTYNGKQFDVPFIFKRSLIQNVPPPARIPIDEYLSKYSTRYHVDLFVLLSEGSLAEWSYLTGNSMAITDGGADIKEWMIKRQYNLIMEKNLADIYQTYSLYKSMKGWLR